MSSMTSIKTSDSLKNYSPIMWVPDKKLGDMDQGNPLYVEELRQLPDDAVVYVTYQNEQNGDCYIHRAMRLREGDDEDTWFLYDGKSFTSKLDLSDEYEEDEQAISITKDDDEVKVMRLWKAIK